MDLLSQPEPKGVTYGEVDQPGKMSHAESANQPGAFDTAKYFDEEGSRTRVTSSSSLLDLEGQNLQELDAPDTYFLSDPFLLRIEAMSRAANRKELKKFSSSSPWHTMAEALKFIHIPIRNNLRSCSFKSIQQILKDAAMSEKSRPFESTTPKRNSEMDFQMSSKRDGIFAPPKALGTPGNASSLKIKKPKTLWEYLSSKGLRPIIVFPSTNSPETLLHMRNCRVFLQEKQLVTEGDDSVRSFYWEAKIPLTSPDSRKEKEVFSRIKIVDTSQVSKFSVSDWYRTVAVFVHGPEWQFKGWPFNHYQNLFACVKSFYVVYEARELSPFISRHDIEILRVKRNSRHGDFTAWYQFLKSLGNALNTPRNFKLFDREKLKLMGGSQSSIKLK